MFAHKEGPRSLWFDLLGQLSREQGCEIVVNQESLSPGQEMVEDLLAIVHTLLCRLSSMRKKNRKLIGNDFRGSKEPTDIVQ